MFKYILFSLNVKLAAEGDGSKIYVSCIAFRDPVSEDIAEAYHIPANSFADKCICLVSRLPSFHVLRNALEELFALCFSPNGSRYVSFSAKFVMVWYGSACNWDLNILSIKLLVRVCPVENSNLWYSFLL